MPLLINNESGLAENIQQEQANAFLQQGSHAVPLVSPEGEHYTGTLEEAPKMLQQGFTQPTPTQLADLLKNAKYSSTSEQIKTGLEGAAEGATFGLSAGVERLMGVAPEAIQARRETNPGIHTAGSIAGTVASAFIPVVGEAGLLEKAGLAASEAAGSAGLGRIGQFAVKQATEMAMLQSGDEISKMFAQDPAQSAQTAAIDIGLSGLMGGVLGGVGKAAVTPLWEAVAGSKLAATLQAVRNKALGIESASIAGDVAEKAGIMLEPEMRAALSGETRATQAAQELRESSTKAGLKYQDGVDKLYTDAKTNVLGTLGKTADQVEASIRLSDYDAGKAVQDSLARELDTKLSPLSKQFDHIKGKYASMPMPEASLQNIGEDLGQMALKEGYALSEGSPALAQVNKVIKSLPNIKTLEDLRKFQTVVREEAHSTQIPGLARKIGAVLRNAEEDTVEGILGRVEPQLVPMHREARAGYKAFMDTVDQLNDRLHAGKYYGPESFVRALGEMRPEDVVRRLKGSKDVDLMRLLQEEFPSTAASVKSYALDSAIKSSQTAGELDVQKLFKTLDKMSPEMKQFVLPAGALEKLDATQKLLASVPDRMNPSGTANTLDALWKKLPGGAGAIISMMLGHNPVMGYVLGSIGRHVGREVPDAGKLALLKFLGSEAPMSASGFKGLYESVVSLYMGARVLDSATKALFTSGEGKIIPFPSPSKTQQLEKALQAAQADPTTLLNASSMGHYAPDHAAASGQTTATAMMYLKGLRPSTSNPGPLDPPREPNRLEKDAYQRALSIAEQPLTVLNYVKEGSVTAKDMETLRTIYPELYSSMSNKIMTNLVNSKSKGLTIPYKTQLGLTLFLGQPLSASVMPQNIVANQQVGYKRPESQASKNGGPHDIKALNKMAASYATPQQAREAQQATIAGVRN